MMSLHDRIMKIEPIGHLSSISRIHFVNARNRAALVATEADELMDEMADALEDAADMLEVNNELGAEAEVRAVITKFYAWKENAK